MKKLIIMGAVLAFFQQVNGQTDKTTKATDSIIKVDIIDPALANVTEGQEPDWNQLSKIITGKYDEIYADRTITKSKIYYYFSRDKKIFTAELASYTEKYEDSRDAKLMFFNANYILRFSDRKSELEKALKWIQPHIRLTENNDVYKRIKEGLEEKSRTTTNR